MAAFVAVQTIATGCAPPSRAAAPDAAATPPVQEVRTSNAAPLRESAEPRRPETAEEVAARSGLEPEMVVPALLSTDPLPRGWRIEEATGLPVDPDDMPHSVGREFAPAILRELPQCWVYASGSGTDSVPVRFLRGAVHVKRGCVDELFFYLATAKRPFEVRSGIAGGYACAPEDADAERVAEAVRAAHDIQKRGERVVLLNERGDETLALVRPVVDCL